MNVIHLASWQKKQLVFNHPLLDQCKKISQKDIPGLVERHLAGDSQATNDLILGHLSFVQWIVGRFLYYWPDTRAYKDDICSEGMWAVVQSVGNISERTDPKLFNAYVITTIKRKIERWLNDMRFPVRASLTTNMDRLKSGKDLEYSDAVQFDEKFAKGAVDENFAFVDMVDALERLKETDGEQLIDLVLEAIENQHQILESELRPQDREMVEKLVSVITE